MTPVQKTCLILSIIVLSAWPVSATILYASSTRSGANVVGTGTTDTQYAMQGSHTAYVTVTVTSPSGRSAMNSWHAYNSLTIYVSLPIFPDDGLFTVQNFGQEYCPAVGRIILAQLTQGGGTNIPGYLWLSTVYWDPGQITMKGGPNGTSKLTVSISKTLHCDMTSVNVGYNVHAITEGLVLVPPLVGERPASFSNGTATQAFAIETDGNNTKAGTVHGDGYIPNGTSCPVGTGQSAVKAATPDLKVQ